MDYENLEEETGTCCFCGDECNILSQSCGSCARSLTFGPLPILASYSDPEDMTNVKITIEEKIDPFVMDMVDSFPNIFIKEVSKITSLICEELKSNYQRHFYTSIVSRLYTFTHTPHSRQRVIKFLADMFPKITYLDTAHYLMKCMDLISFKKEQKNGPCYYHDLLPPYWIQIRNIVADADKLMLMRKSEIKKFYSPK